MAVESASVEKYQITEPVSSKASSDAGSETSSTGLPATADPSDRTDLLKESDLQPSLRSEEYRQLFRLPPEEVLIRDFNCAFQESILLQGHMYVFTHYICFYSNIFGFETKKIVPFHEVTCVRRAKTAAIFPTAIEIFAGGKKYVFASFLSRDEAFKLINDGWAQHSNSALDREIQNVDMIMGKILPLEAKSESSIHENGLAIENVKSMKDPANELDLVERNKDAQSGKLPPGCEDEIMQTTLPEVQDIVEEYSEPVSITESSSSGRTLTWKPENSDAPAVPKYYTRIAESKYPIKVEDFFSLFFSDDAVGFVESFHRNCGDKDFKCSSWSPHTEFGHTRQVSFQHPIKIYFGARYGSCQEVQKFRVYRNSHLVIETSQEVSDVPYGDYFRVEWLWDVERDNDESKECCLLQVYVNVAFSKKTMWKGKIEQSTVEECREAYDSWLNTAHELLRQHNLEKKEEGSAAKIIQNGQAHPERQVEIEKSVIPRKTSEDAIKIPPKLSGSKGVSVPVHTTLQRDASDATSVALLVKESIAKFCSYLRSQPHLPLLLVVSFAMILLLMQLSIVVLLARPQEVRVISQADHASAKIGGGVRDSETTALLDNWIQRLKNELIFIDSQLDKMRNEHQLLKAQLKDLELLRKQR